MTRIKFYLSAFLLAAPLLLNAQTHDDASLSALLGGVVQSDSWVIRKDKLEEEFIGNVRYENETYKIRADRALSRRKERTFSIEGNVFAARRGKDFNAEITASKIFYDSLRKSGFALAPKKGRLALQYEPAGGNLYRLWGERLDFSNSFNFFTLSGKSELNDGANTLLAEQMSYDRQTGLFDAQGQRPLLTGSNKDAYYALQADKITAHTRDGLYKAQGRAHGWVAAVKDAKDFKRGL